MAISNVRFYKLNVLPNFEAKHKGIFVHVAETMQNTEWIPTNYKEKVDPATLWMTLDQKMSLTNWLSKRNITYIESGLWFGGENGWELLSNETNSAAINAAITAKIQDLDVTGYAQATINTDTPAEGEPNSSTLTIKGIQEVDGKIGIPAESENLDLDLDIAIDGVYNESSNKIATESTVTTAITGLNAETVQAVTFNTSVANGNTTLTFKGVKEANGVIAQGDEQNPDTFIVGDAKLNIEIGVDSFEVFSANAKENKSIYLDENVFKKNVVDGKNVLSVVTKNNDVSSDNPLVTEQDIANLSGAMHYKGAITSANSSTPDNWPSTVKAGDVYIATGNFVKDGNTIESGDLIVFNSATLTDYKVVQSNITLGIGDGQVAANVGALTNGNLVVGVNDPETGKGIKTIGITESDLTGTTGKNERKLTYDNGAPDTSDATLFHSATIKDTLKVIGKDFTETINISSTNRSIKIAANASENATGVMVDLVWNTTIE